VIGGRYVCGLISSNDLIHIFQCAHHIQQAIEINSVIV
jgi:hypothetical protein